MPLICPTPCEKKPGSETLMHAVNYDVIKIGKSRLGCHGTQWVLSLYYAHTMARDRGRDSPAKPSRPGTHFAMKRHTKVPPSLILVLSAKGGRDLARFIWAPRNYHLAGASRPAAVSLGGREQALAALAEGFGASHRLNLCERTTRGSVFDCIGRLVYRGVVGQPTPLSA